MAISKIKIQSQPTTCQQCFQNEMEVVEEGKQQKQGSAQTLSQKPAWRESPTYGIKILNLF